VFVVRELIDFAIDQGRNPEEQQYTMIGGLLEIILNNQWR